MKTMRLRDRLPAKNILAAAGALLLTVFTIPSFAQNYNVIQYFSGGPGGATPVAGLTIDQHGNLYGTTFLGGVSNCTGDGCGIVFKMSPSGSNWIFTPLYTFQGGNDGGQPEGPVTFDRSGALYGTAYYGPGQFGEVYQLRPSASRPRSALAPWTKTDLLDFNNHNGAVPTGRLAIDAAGNIYGTTAGNADHGTVYELSPSAGGWTETTLYTFQGGADGGYPEFGLVMDGLGRLYGATQSGGANRRGTIFQLAPSGSGWTFTTLYSLSGFVSGGPPASGLTLDSAGNLHGTTYPGNFPDLTTVYELSPDDGGWTFHVLKSFTNQGYATGDLAVDAAGNVYGTTWRTGPTGYGNIFKLTKSGSDWLYSDLYDFNCSTDGCTPLGVSIDSAGHLLGMTEYGGINDSYCEQTCGVVWELTQ
jgi:uncharacterized repeat protein (TIGR03803 family)